MDNCPNCDKKNWKGLMHTGYCIHCGSKDPNYEDD